MKLTSLSARQILDSRGNPTVEVEARSRSTTVRALVPSGASTGVYEAKELRDGGKAWNGNGVQQAVRNVNTILAKQLTNKSFSSQAAFDAALIALDGTKDKSKLGANALLGASMAYARLVAAEQEQQLFQYIAAEYNTKPRLPVIFANVINGGKHAGNGLPMQEFMIAPQASSFQGAVEEITTTYHALKASIKTKYGGLATGVGDEGGFAPPVKTAEECLQLLQSASKAAGTKVRFAIDAAASEFYDEKTKRYALHKSMTTEQLADYYRDLIKTYKIRSLEDPFEEHAFDAFASLRGSLKGDCQIVGDDLTVSNPVRVQQAIMAKSCSALLLKVNQIGTVSEAVTAAQLATQAGWAVMVSHRSGETDDAFISHLATGLGTGQIKIGAPCRGERVAKYNELLRISEHCKRYS
jgi:enolase